MFLHVFRMSARARTTRKWIENRSECASRPSRVTDRLRKRFFSRSEASKWSPEAYLRRVWTLLSDSWDALGRSWGALGRSWGALGRSWEALGALLGRSWGAFGRSWALLGRSWGVFGWFWAVLGSLGPLPGPPGLLLGVILASRGSLFRGFGGVFLLLGPGPFKIAYF